MRGPPPLSLSKPPQFPFGVFGNSTFFVCFNRARVDQTAEACFIDARVVTQQTASRSREKFEPPNFTRDAKLPSGHLSFFLPKPIGPPASIEPSRHPSATRCATTERDARRVGPHTRPRATPLHRHPCAPARVRTTRNRRASHIAPFAERVSTRTHDASAGGARQRRRQSETSVSRLALARFSRRDRPGPGSGARDEAPRTRSNAPTVRYSRPPTKFTR